MTDDEEALPSAITSVDPINFQELKEEIRLHGPLQLSQRNNPYKVLIDVHPCMCADIGCNEELVSVHRKNGLFSIHWMLSKDEFLEFGTYEEFLKCVNLGGLTESRGERMIIEVEAQRIFEQNFREVTPVQCTCDGCFQKFGEEGLWKRILVSQLSFILKHRDDILKEVSDNGDEEQPEFVSQIFDLGYAAGRIFSELKVKSFIEPHAIDGINFGKLKERRAKAAGLKSAKSRLERVKSLLLHMERLIASNPELGRMGADAVAELACEDAVTENPNLWTQGQGQVSEYLGELRRGELGDDLRSRLSVLFATRPKSKHI